MILLAGLIRLPLGAIAVFGGLVVGLHNLIDFLPQAVTDSLQSSPLAWLWQLLYFGGPVSLGSSGPTLAVLYSIIPWIGVMALGYAFGWVIQLDGERRRRLCSSIGLSAIGLFVVLRATNWYGDPRPWTGSKLPSVLAFLNAAKYPASLSFLLMTLGPVIAMLPFFDRLRGPVARMLNTFGRVPFFFYLLHIPLIHALALVVAAIRDRAAVWWLFTNHPMMAPPPPPGYVWSLSLLYLVFTVTIGLLYFPCRRFASLKATRSSRWLSYL